MQPVPVQRSSTHRLLGRLVFELPLDSKRTRCVTEAAVSCLKERNQTGDMMKMEEEARKPWDQYARTTLDL